MTVDVIARLFGRRRQQNVEVPDDIETEIIAGGHERHYDGYGRKVYDVELPKPIPLPPPPPRPICTVVLLERDSRTWTIERYPHELNTGIVRLHGPVMCYRQTNDRPWVYRRCHPTVAKILEARAHRVYLEKLGTRFYRSDPARLR